MKPDELFALISDALSTLVLNLSLERDKRVYLAYLASRVGQGEDGDLVRRLEALRKELGL